MRASLLVLIVTGWLAAPAAQADSIVIPHPALGLVPGQSLRLSVANTPPPRSAGPWPVRMTVRVFDQRGRQLDSSAALLVRDGMTAWWSLSRDAIGLAGESGSGRLQVRVETRLEADPTPAAEKRLLFLTLELVNDLTGESGMIGDVRTVISGEAAFQSANQGFYD